MPIHIAPVIRALEEALEAEGLIKPLDSYGIANRLVNEAAATKVKVVPVAQVRIIRGNTYKAS